LIVLSEQERSLQLTKVISAEKVGLPLDNS